MKKLTFLLFLLISWSVQAIPTANAEEANEFGDWVRNCAEDEGAEVCQISQFTRQAESESLLFEMTVGYLPGAALPVVFLTAPLGIHLPRGITIQLTDETLMTVAVQRCTTVGCVAVATLDEAFLNEMKASKEGLVVFGRNAEQNVGVPLSLVGFNEALNSIAPN